MVDYTYPSVFFAYGLFFLFVIGALYFFARTWKDGYWGEQSEESKYRMLQDEEVHHGGR